MKPHFLLPLLCALPLTAAAATKTWDDGGADDNFNNPSNWNPTGAPVDGDDLVFPSTIAADTVNNNITGRTFGSITIQKGLTIAGNAFSLSGGISSTPPVLGAPVVIEPNVTLTASQTFASGGGTLSSLTFGGNVTFGGRTLTLAGSRATVYEGITGASTVGTQFVKSGAGPLRFGPSCIFVLPQAYTHAAGTLDVDGFFSPALTMTGGTLTGEGTLNAGINASGGTIIPDEGDLQVSGATLLRGTVILRVALLGPSDETALECSAVTIADQATLEVLGTAYTPIRGDGFLVLSKSTASAITGTFSNAPQASEIPAGSAVLSLSYTGGNGNDLALTTISTTRTWDGGATLNDNWDDADNWTGNIVPQTGDVLIFPAGIGSTDRGLDNNFPNDTTFRRLNFTGGDFTVRGNRFRLTHGISTLAGQFTSIDTDVVLAQDQTFDLNGTLHLDLLDNIVTNGRTLTLAGTGRLDGSISGTGGLRVPAGSVIQLSANSSYAGITTVEAGGELVVDGRDEALGSAAGRTEVRGQLEFDASNLPIGGRLVTAENLLLLPLSTLTLRGHGSSRIVHTGTVELAGPGSVLLSVVPNTDVTFEGVISGPASVTLNSSDTAFTGNTSNTFSGPLSVARGSLILEKSNPGVLAVPCASFIVQGDGTEVETRQDEQIADTCHVQLLDGTYLRIGNITARTETIGSLSLQGTLDSPCVVGGADDSELIIGGHVSVLPGAVSIPHTFSTGSVDPSGIVTFKATPCVMDVGDVFGGVDVQFTGVNARRTGAGSIRKTGPGTVRWTEVSVPMEILAGGMDFIGNGSGSPITLNGGEVTGDGSCGSITSATGGGMIKPGTSETGILNTGSLTLNGATTFQTHVRTANPGTGFDQVSVTGGVSLGGAVLQLQHLLNFDVIVGQNIFPLLNDGTDPIVGTFAGLPQAAYIDAPDPHAGGWIISYSGGSGNDVSLARVAAPPVAPKLNTVTFRRGTGPNGQDQVALTGTATPSAVLSLEASTDLNGWTTLQSVAATAAGAVNVTVNQTPGQPKRFFRLRP